MLRAVQERRRARRTALLIGTVSGWLAASVTWWMTADVQRAGLVSVVVIALFLSGSAIGFRLSGVWLRLVLGTLGGIVACGFLETLLRVDPLGPNGSGAWALALAEIAVGGYVLFVAGAIVGWLCQWGARRRSTTAPSLRGADLEAADLTNADLIGADLSHATLTNADLRGADLSGAILTGAELEGATYNAGTRWPVGFDPEAAGCARTP